MRCNLRENSVLRNCARTGSMVNTNVTLPSFPPILGGTAFLPSSVGVVRQVVLFFPLLFFWEGRRRWWCCFHSPPFGGAAFPLSSGGWRCLVSSPPLGAVAVGGVAFLPILWLGLDGPIF